MSDEFATLSLPSAISYLELSHHKLRRATSFLKHLAEVEASYSKDILKLIGHAESSYRERDDRKSPPPISSSDLLFLATLEAARKRANQHAIFAKELQAQVAAPLKEFRLKAEDARKKFQQTHSKLVSQLKDTTDSISKERAACSKLLEQYRAESSGQPVQDKSFGLFGKKNVADKPNVVKALSTFQINWLAAHTQQKTQFETETKTLKEIQTWEEEKVCLLKRGYTTHSTLLKEHLITPYQNNTSDVDTKLEEYCAPDEIKNVLDGKLVAKREAFTWIPYELPCAASDISDDSFVSGKPNSVVKGGPTTEKKEPLIVGSSSSDESKTPAPVPSSVTAKFATSASSSIVPGTTPASKLAPAAAAVATVATGDSVSVKASKMGAAPSGMFLPTVNTSTSSSVPKPMGSPEKLHATSDDTFIKVVLPSGLGHITLAASQIPTVKLIKSKIIAKLERQGKADVLSSDAITDGQFRLSVQGSSGIDVPDGSSMSSLLDMARMYLPPGKPVELELVVQGTATTTTAKAASPRSSPVPSARSVSPAPASAPLADETGPEIQHAARAKISRTKKPAKKAGFSGLFKKSAPKKKTKPATGGLGAFDASAVQTGGDGDVAAGITLATADGKEEEHSGDEEEEGEEDDDEGADSSDEADEEGAEGEEGDADATKQ